MALKKVTLVTFSLISNIDLVKTQSDSSPSDEPNSSEEPSTVTVSTSSSSSEIISEYSDSSESSTSASSSSTTQGGQPARSDFKHPCSRIVSRRVRYELDAQFFHPLGMLSTVGTSAYTKPAPLISQRLYESSSTSSSSSSSSNINNGGPYSSSRRGSGSYSSRSSSRGMNSINFDDHHFTQELREDLQPYGYLAANETYYPPNCPFLAGNTWFDVQESHKRRLRPTTPYANWECGICKKKFRSEHYMDLHMERRHMGEPWSENTGSSSGSAAVVTESSGSGSEGTVGSASSEANGKNNSDSNSEGAPDSESDSSAVTAPILDQHNIPALGGDFCLADMCEALNLDGCPGSSGTQSSCNETRMDELKQICEKSILDCFPPPLPGPATTSNSKKSNPFSLAYQGPPHPAETTEYLRIFFRKKFCQHLSCSVRSLSSKLKDDIHAQHFSLPVLILLCFLPISVLVFTGVFFALDYSEEIGSYLTSSINVFLTEYLGVSRERVVEMQRGRENMMTGGYFMGRGGGGGGERRKMV